MFKKLTIFIVGIMMAPLVTLATIDKYFIGKIEKGHELIWLKDVSLWDKNSEICNKFTNGGIPLTILID